jgi:hypothetical protein
MLSLSLSLSISLLSFRSIHSSTFSFLRCRRLSKETVPAQVKSRTRARVARYIRDRARGCRLLSSAREMSFLTKFRGRAIAYRNCKSDFRPDRSTLAPMLRALGEYSFAPADEMKFLFVGRLHARIVSSVRARIKQETRRRCY